MRPLRRPQHTSDSTASCSSHRTASYADGCSLLLIINVELLFPSCIAQRSAETSATTESLSLPCCSSRTISENRGSRRRACNKRNVQTGAGASAGRATTSYENLIEGRRWMAHVASLILTSSLSKNTRKELMSTTNSHLVAHSWRTFGWRWSFCKLRNGSATSEPEHTTAWFA